MIGEGDRFGSYRDASCAFCGEGAAYRPVFGTPQSIVRICAKCLGLCCSILAEDAGESYLDEATAVQQLERVRVVVAKLVARRGADTNKPPDSPYACTFCRKGRHEVAKLVSAPRVFICEGCVLRAVVFINEDSPKT